MAAGPVSERNQDATIYVGGLDEKVFPCQKKDIRSYCNGKYQVNEALLWELFVQAGPVVNVHMPKDRVTMQHQGEASFLILVVGSNLTNISIFDILSSQATVLLSS